MFPFVEYQVKVAVILAAFYFVYRLLMGRETFHRVNRVMLLAVPVLVAVLPLFFHLHRGGCTAGCRCRHCLQASGGICRIVQAHCHAGKSVLYVLHTVLPVLHRCGGGHGTSGMLVS